MPFSPFEPVVEVSGSQHPRTGKWSHPCPLCPFVSTGYIAAASWDRLVTHMYIAHHDHGKAGHA